MMIRNYINSEVKSIRSFRVLVVSIIITFLGIPVFFSSNIFGIRSQVRVIFFYVLVARARVCLEFTVFSRMNLDEKNIKVIV